MSPDLLAEKQKKALNGFLSSLSSYKSIKATTIGSSHVSATTTCLAASTSNALATPAAFEATTGPSPGLTKPGLYHAPSNGNRHVILTPTENRALPDIGTCDEDAADDSGSETEGVKRWLINDEPRIPRKITERKRADAAAFDVWLELHEKKLADDGQPVPDDERSLAWLVKDDGSYNIIDSPFDYQVELFEKAKEQNTIAVLDTGKCVSSGRYFDTH
jgi:endoribonuclease Dicer